LDAAPKTVTCAYTIYSITRFRFQNSKIILGENRKMVKFRVRWMKKRYKKNKEYNYKKYLIEFPVKVNPKIDPHETKNFDDIDITSKDTPKQEFLNIQLVRNKTPEEINKQKHD
jgi:hypothetical protein